MTALPAAHRALAVLTLVNVLSYVDRFIIAALLPSIQGELDLSDGRAGLLGTAFIVVYFACSPLFGWAGDRRSRKGWLALGVGLWSVATGLAGFARGWLSLLCARAAVGVGEAAYGTISPTLIADYYPRKRRGLAMSVFYLAIPVGSALGYLLGGVLGTAIGWRAAFAAVGFPGLALALAILALKEPTRGAQDEPSDTPAPSGLLQVYRALLVNRLYRGTVLGYAAYTFAIGGLAFWTPSYMMRVRGYDQATGMLWFGGITVATGFAGTLAGGWLGDRLLKITRHGYSWVSATSVALGTVLTFGALLAPSNAAFLGLLALAQLCLFANTGPVNTLIVNAVPPSMRATAVAVSIFVIHLLGDAISPALIGVLSDRAGLAAAMLAIPAVFLLAALLWTGPLLRRTAASG